MLFEPKKQTIPSKVLHEKYIVPPFSVFNTHQPYWKERTEFWLALGIGGTNGRRTSNNGLTYDNRRMDKKAGNNSNFNGTSTFSPVLAEVVYKWFTVPGSNKVFDPFAGGITRGCVAAALGHFYIGCDINPVQIQSNIEEKQKVAEKYNIEGNCSWVLADSASLSEDIIKADLIFTCPPYYNLETYTNKPEDLSNCNSYTEFLKKYTQIINLCYNVLEEDRFMVWVVSDVRDKKTTEYYGLVADTIKAAQEAGFKFYNEIILYNETGNLAIVSGDYIDRYRKVGRQHQNVLVFYKGDPKNIKEKFGKVVE